MNGRLAFERNPKLKALLRHYFQILSKETHAFYIRCKQIPVLFDYDDSDENLWKLHSTLSSQISLNTLAENHQQISCESDKNFLSLKIELANRFLRKCTLCANDCKVNRLKNELGVCCMNANALLSSAFLHYGEESPLVPSGTLFFCGCTFDCCFCQNSEISRIGKVSFGIDQYPNVSFQRIVEITNDLVDQGAININYVGGDPTPNIPTILSSMEFQTKNVCQLWNSNLYNSLASLKLLADVVDLWLPDFKYGNNKCGERYSNIALYFDVITRNLKYIYEHGSKSIIIRHLVMPNHIECCSFPILEFISKNIPNVVVNLMAQYHPAYKVNKTSFPLIDRRITADEMKRVNLKAEELGIHYQILR